MDRFEGVEERLDALSDRFVLGEQHERRDAQHMMRVLDRVAAAAERQSAALEAAALAIERLEQRVKRVERWVTEAPPPFSSGPPRRSRDASSSSLRPEACPDLESRPGLSRSPAENASNLDARARSRLSDWPSRNDADANPDTTTTLESYVDGPVVSGSLPELSLATLLSMFELERRTGCLSVEAATGEKVRFDLYAGAIVACALDGESAEVVECLREALSWREGRFCFRHIDILPGAAPPHSIGSLLLEATRQYDEALRS